MDIEKWRVYFFQKRNAQPMQSHNLEQVKTITTPIAKSLMCKPARVKSNSSQ